MSTDGLTRAQHLALTLDRNLSVTAGAGTGKTRVLVNRSLRILDEARRKDRFGNRGGARPDQVVAVTFTRKAASQMREKVTLSVTKKVQAARREGDKEAYAYWMQVRRDLPEALIHTIHGLAARIVRLAAVELDVDPRFQVAEGIDTKLLAEDCVSQVLRETEPALDRAVRELYVLHGARGVRGLLGALLSDRVHADPWARSLVDVGVEGTLESLWDALVGVGGEEAETIARGLHALHARLEPRVRTPPPPDSTPGRLLHALAACAQETAGKQAIRWVWNLLQCCTTKDGDLYKAAHHAVGTAMEWTQMGLPGEGKAVYEEITDVLAPLVGRLTGVPGESDRRGLEVLHALARLHLQVIEHYDDRKRRRGWLDYHDLEVLALRALRQPGVAEELRQGIRFLLVDEFQDTNENQWAILEELAKPAMAQETAAGRATPVQVEAGAWSSAEDLQAGTLVKTGQSTGSGGTVKGTEAGAEAEKASPRGLELVEIDDAAVEAEAPLGQDRLFIVGDAKQSIYAFRGADITVYQGSRRAVTAANTWHALDEETPEVALNEAWQGLEPPGYEERSGQVRLDRNFRSLSSLVRFTNAFFQRLFVPEDPAGRRDHEAEPGPLSWERHALVGPDGKEATTGSVRVLATPRSLHGAVERGEMSAAEADRIGHVRHQMAMLVKDIKTRVEAGPQRGGWWVADAKNDPKRRQGRPAEYRDVAVLLPRKTNLRVLEEQFRASGVPYTVVGGRGFWSQQEVYDAVNMLQVVADPRRDVELLSVLRSPFFAWSDESIALLASAPGGSLWRRLCDVADGKAEWTPPASLAGAPPREVVQAVRRWHSLAGGCSTARLLATILEETPYVPALRGNEPEPTGKRAVSNLEKLIHVVRRLEDRRGRNLAPIVRDLAALADADAEEAEAVVPEDEGAGVRVMTVHAAKGLEFPVVYVADLDARLQTGLSKEARALDFARVQNAAFYVLKARGEDGETEESFVDRWVRRESLKRARAEYKRLLYVATTRAQDHLVLVGSSRRLDGEPGKTPPALQDPNETLTWMDWVEGILSLDHETYKQVLKHPGRHGSVRLPEVDADAMKPDADTDADKDKNVDVEVEVGLQRLDTPPPTAHTPGTQTGVTAAGPEAQPVQVAPAPVQAPPATITVHPSQLSLYTECHARFRYRVVEGYSEGWVKGVHAAARPYGEAFGSLFHRTLATADAAGTLPEGTEKRLEGLLRHHADEHWPPKEVIRKNLLAHAQRASSVLSSRYPGGARLVEADMDAEVAPGLRIRGRLDRLHMDGDGNLVVVDLKTDAVPPGKEPDHAATHGHDAQVLLYDAALRRAGHKTAPPALLYTATGALVPIDNDGRGGTVLDALADRIQDTLKARATGETPDRLDTIWPTTAPGVKTCAGCGFFSGNGGPCPGVGSDPKRADPVKGS